MKHYSLLLKSTICLSFLLFLGTSGVVYGQGATCDQAQAFCSDGGATFAAGVNVPGVTPDNNDYSCPGDNLITQPNPAWYYLEIDQGGYLEIDLITSPPEDIDFAIWGPYPDLASATSQCNTPGLPEAVDCSFDPAENEQVNVNNTQPGEIYILVITNYSNSPTQISANTTGGSVATTDCNIVGCDAESGTYTPSGTGDISSTSAVLCLGDDVSLTSDDNYVLPPPTTGEEAELMYAIYDCEPTVADPDSDPCFTGLFWTGEDYTTTNTSGGIPQDFIDAGITGDASNTVWLVPYTMDDGDNNGNPNGVINIDNSGDNCWDFGQPYAITFFDPPTIVTSTTCDINTSSGSITVDVGGTGVYTITDTGDGNIGPSTIGAGSGGFMVTGLSDGDTWSFDLGQGSCSETFSGTFNCGDDACLINYTLVATPPVSDFPNNQYPPDTDVTFCFNILEYNQTNSNFLQGVIPTTTGNWSNPVPTPGTGTPDPQGNNEDGSQWDWFPGGVVDLQAGAGSGTTVADPGWWFQSVNSPGFSGNINNVDPDDSWGDGCTLACYPDIGNGGCNGVGSFTTYISGCGCTGSLTSGFGLWVGPSGTGADITDNSMDQTLCDSYGGQWIAANGYCSFYECQSYPDGGDGLQWTFCFDVTTDPCNPTGADINGDLGVSIKTYADGEAGIWTNAGCTVDEAITTDFTMCCIPPPTTIPNTFCEEGAISLAVDETVTDWDTNWDIDWYTQATGGLSIGSGNPFDPGALDPGTYTFFAETNQNGCLSETRTPVTIVVDPLPVITIDDFDKEICGGQSAAINTTVQYETSISWSPNTSSVDDVTVTPTAANPFSQTVYTITATNACGSVTESVEIFTYIAPDISTTDPTICAGESFDLNSLTINDAVTWGSPADTTITYHSATPPDGTNELGGTVVSPSTTTTYYVQSINGDCPDVVPVTVNVNSAVNFAK